MGMLDTVAVIDTPSVASTDTTLRQPAIPNHLNPHQQQQLASLLEQYGDLFSQGDDDIVCTPVLGYTIATQGLPIRQPCNWQNSAVWKVEADQVQQVLSSDIIKTSNSPRASPVLMMQKKDGQLLFCVEFHQLNAMAT